MIANLSFKNMIAMTSFMSILSLPNSWSAFSAEQQQHSFKVERILIEGLHRTNEKVVRRELTYKEGDTITAEAITESIQRLYNTHLFAKVSHEFNEAQQTSTFHIEERWTTIPIAKFNSGGGVNQLILGAYDINVFGLFLEAGGQYERLGETDSGVIWFRNPRLFGKRLKLSIDLWQVNRLRTLYENFGDSLKQEAVYLQTRNKASIALQKEWLSWLKTSINVDSHRDKFSTRYVEDEQLQKQDDDVIPDDRHAIQVGYDLTLGRINYGSWRSKGWELLQKYRYNASEDEDNGKAFHLAEVEGLYYKDLFLQSTLGVRLAGGRSLTESDQEYFYVGGLDRLRGFSDARFRGNNYWLSNLEYRIPSYVGSWWVIQHVVFHDIASVYMNNEGYEGISGASYGTGLRFISPKIYRFVGRIDFARPYKGSDEKPISFGVQQFF